MSAETVELSEGVSTALEAAAVVAASDVVVEAVVVSVVEAASDVVDTVEASVEVVADAESVLVVVALLTVDESEVVLLVVSVPEAVLRRDESTGSEDDPARLLSRSDRDRLLCCVVVSSVTGWLVVDKGVVDEKVVVTLGNCLLTSRGKYILGLATGSALASVETATSAVTRSDFVCILRIYDRFIRAADGEIDCWD